jgi:hypothetical protein
MPAPFSRVVKPPLEQPTTADNRKTLTLIVTVRFM